MVNSNTIPFGHFHKDWQKYLRTWFDQKGQKERRHRIRERKLRKAAPQPVEKLRPLVHCPSFRYHSKLRAGRGFSRAELKAAKINPKFAKSIGICVDNRRRNKSVESILRNAQRLKEYQSRLILFPNKEAPVAKLMQTGLNTVKKQPPKLTARVPTEQEKKFEAKNTLRHARADKKYFGRRLKIKKLKEAGAEITKSPKRARKPLEDD